MASGVTLNAAQSTTDTSSTSKAAGKAASDVESAFLSLLTTQLKAQDPTSPMDSTAMVSQMISLNQLNQTIAIRELLQSSIQTQGTSSTGSK